MPDLAIGRRRDFCRIQALPGESRAIFKILEEDECAFREVIHMGIVKVTALKNGPYKVEGSIELYHDTVSVDTAGKDAVFLCRCGASSKKPFCDGTHSKIGFQAAASAVPESKEE